MRSSKIKTVNKVVIFFLLFIAFWVVKFLKTKQVLAKLNDNNQSRITNKSRFPINQIDLCNRSISKSSRGIEDNSHGTEITISPLVVAMVLSKRDNWTARQMVRATWGGREVTRASKQSVVFIVGTSNSRSKALEKEAIFYQDIVQVDVIDSYTNLTLKTLAGLEWCLTYCSNTRWIFKTDDDVLVNVFAFKQFIENLEAKNQINNTNTSGKSPNSSVIYCEHLHTGLNTLVMRSGIFEVSFANYNETFFPEYCTGLGYLLPKEILKPLILETLKTPIITIEDVFITGILASNLNISRQRMHHLIMQEEENSLSSYQLQTHFLNGTRFALEVTRNMENPAVEIKVLWEKLLYRWQFIMHNV